MKRKRRVERAEVGERRNGGSASINRWEGQGKASSMEHARWMTGLSVLEKEGRGGNVGAVILFVTGVCER